MPESRLLRIAVDAREITTQPAGKGRYTIEFIKHLAQIDNTNTYYLYADHEIPLDLPSNFQHVPVSGAMGMKQLKMVLDAKKRSCDLFFAPTAYLPAILSPISSVVVVADLASFVTSKARPAFRTLVAERLLLKLATLRAQKIIAISQATKHDLIHLFGVPKKKIEVVLLAYDKTLFTPPSEKTSRDDRKILEHYKLPTNYLLFIGTLEPRKNIVGIIEAFSRLSPEQRQKYPLIIGGKKGWFYEEIFARVTKLKLEWEVRFLGRVSDEHLPALYRHAKLFLFPSFYEGFGLPPLEALACGTPVLTADNSSLPEVVNGAGILVNADSPREIADALTRALTDGSLYRELKEKALPQAAQFDWRSAAEQLLTIFRDSAERTTGKS